MAKYNVDDKVKYVGNDDVFKHGEILTVKEDDGGSYLPLFVSNGWCNQWISYDDVKPDKPTKNQRITTLESQVAELQAEVAALKKGNAELKATPKFEAVTTDNIAVGDKIRVIDRSAIWINDDLTDGETYVVFGVWDDGQTLRVRDDDDYTLISDDEFHAIEKVVSE